MKRISVCIPCFNESTNIAPMYECLTRVFSVYDGVYDYEILFADNSSTDGSRDEIRGLCCRDNHVKAIFNTRNYGAVASNRNALLSATGDAVVTLDCDFQNPPDLIHKFISLWEDGALVVCGQKSKTEEHGPLVTARKIFYKIINNMSDVQQNAQVTGFSLMDRSVIESIRSYGNPKTPLRFVLSDIGYPITLVPYRQGIRRSGNSSYTISKYFEFAIDSLVETSSKPMRIASIVGAGLSAVLMVVILFLLVWGMVSGASLGYGELLGVLCTLFVGCSLLFSSGILGEYLLSVRRRVEKHPGVFEIERLGLDRESARTEDGSHE